MVFARTLAAAVLCLAFSPALAKQISATHAHASKHEKHTKAEKHSKADKHAAKSEKKPESPWRMIASVYWEGNRTASGRKFDPNAMTVAHKTLPFGTRLLVTYDGSVVEVVVTDRGPFVHGRDIDLTRGVAKALHFSGVGKIKVAYWPPLPTMRPSSAPPRPVPPIEISGAF